MDSINFNMISIMSLLVQHTASDHIPLNTRVQTTFQDRCRLNDPKVAFELHLRYEQTALDLVIGICLYSNIFRVVCLRTTAIVMSTY